MTHGNQATVMVTGASAGLGKAIVRRYVELGYHVVAAARRDDRLTHLANELGPSVHPLQLDVRSYDDVAEAVSHLPADFSQIDMLINNAGLAVGLEPAQTASLDDWEQMVETNCMGMLHCTRAILPGMMQRHRGHVVNIGSVAGTYPYPGGNVYGATKAFVHQFSMNLRSDLHGSGLRVTCIEPGTVGNTEFSIVRFRGDEEQATQVYRDMNPLMPDDIAEAVLWATRQPPHVNVNSIELMPTSQSFAAFPVHRPTGNRPSQEPPPDR